MTNNRVLIIQGAGDGAHLEDKALADYLESALGPAYRTTYPRFPGLENVAYDAWKQQLDGELERLGEGGIVVAHSLGGSAMLKYLSEGATDLPPAALFLVAPPYKGKDGEWGTDDFAMDAGAAADLPAVMPVFIYHSRDDEWVPFAHLAQWVEKIPGAEIREFDDRGHSFTSADFVELVEDIRAL